MTEEEMTLEEYMQMREDLKKKRKPNKYRAIKTEVDGIKFDSRKEAARYSELKLLQQAGAICQLETQKRFYLRVKDQKVCDYICDFFYYDKEKEEWIIEDVKSTATRTPVYRLKKKLMRAILGIEITEV